MRTRIVMMVSLGLSAVAMAGCGATKEKWVAAVNAKCAAIKPQIDAAGAQLKAAKTPEQMRAGVVAIQAYGTTYVSDIKAIKHPDDPQITQYLALQDQELQAVQAMVAAIDARNARSVGAAAKSLGGLEKQDDTAAASLGITQCGSDQSSTPPPASGGGTSTPPSSGTA